MALCTGSRTSDDQINNDFFINIESNQIPKVLPVARKSAEQEEALLQAECDQYLSNLISRMSNRDEMDMLISYEHARKSVEQEEALLSHLSIGNDAYGAREEAELNRYMSNFFSRLSNLDDAPDISDEEITTWALRIKELARGYPRSGGGSYKALCQRVGYAIGAYGENEEESKSGGKKLKSKCFLRLEAGKADPDAYSDPLMKDFCKEFNQRTAQLSGDDLGVVIKKYDDGTFSFTFGHFIPCPTGLL